MPCGAQLPVPETLDVLLVEQEVVGTEQSALEVRLHPLYKPVLWALVLNPEH